MAGQADTREHEADGHGGWGRSTATARRVDLARTVSTGQVDDVINRCDCRWSTPRRPAVGCIGFRRPSSNRRSGIAAKFCSLAGHQWLVER